MNRLISLVAAAGLFTAAEAAAQDTLNSVDRTRGGRHWIDMKTPPPRSPAETLEALQVEPGKRIELVAAEPLVMDPVAIAFDEAGRMFVVEYGDYPTGPPDGNEPLSRVVLLEDRDGDGTMDRRHVFADKLNFAHSLMPYKNGILVGAQTEIIYLRDSNGDDTADVRTVLFSGFVPAHPQMQIGNPRWGMDNQVYLNYGPGKIKSAADPDKTTDMPRLDFRFDPLTMKFGPDSGLGQFGNTIDNWGNRFFATNRNPIMTAMLPRKAVLRNPFVVIPKAYTDVGPSGGNTRVYPLVEMKSNWLLHAGTHTSACGVTAYRGDLFEPGFDRSVFVCEPVGHLVTRSIVTPDGTRLNAKRAREKADFVASSDTWFRPASLATGPDGAIYLADMYRLWVEHPKFMPEDVAARMDWRAGDDRGRIWRIVPENGTLREFNPPANTMEVVNLLKDGNGWRRHLGQRLLVERQSAEAAPALVELLQSSDQPLTRLHALWTLNGIGRLTSDNIAAACKDSDPVVRRDAVRIAGHRVADDSDLLTSMLALVNDADVRVRRQLAISLGEVDPKSVDQHKRAAQALAKLSLSDGSDEWFALSILTSSRDSSEVILDALAASPDFTADGNESRIQFLRRLAGVVGARGDTEELGRLLNLLSGHGKRNGEKSGNNEGESVSWWQMAALSGLADGLSRHRGSLGRTNLQKLLNSPPDSLVDAAKSVHAVMTGTLTVATDVARPVTDRVCCDRTAGVAAHRQHGRHSGSAAFAR